MPLVVAAYRFVELGDCHSLRERLHGSARDAELKGTVLLAPEGINLFLAGEAAALQRWLGNLMRDARFENLELKTSPVETLPFRHLRVKVKCEIIRMNRPGVRPGTQRAPAVDAATLARWLAAGRCDAGRELALLDTRNGFEVDIGTFEGALDWRLRRFGDFPAALDAHRAELAGKTVVSFCTGGIRCEKAALWMAEQGVPHVLQLDGGILKYFAAMAGAPHFRGSCFVFDERFALDADLRAA